MMLGTQRHYGNRSANWCSTPLGVHQSALIRSRRVGSRQNHRLRACDHWGDREATRQDMRHQVAEVPPEHRAKLLTHFERS